jgi:hypothetical protein
MHITKLLGVDFSPLFSYFFPVRFKFYPHLHVVLNSEDLRQFFTPMQNNIAFKIIVLCIVILMCTL